MLFIFSFFISYSHILIKIFLVNYTTYVEIGFNHTLFYLVYLLQGRLNSTRGKLKRWCIDEWIVIHCTPTTFI